jgi:hypothetical protein
MDPRDGRVTHALHEDRLQLDHGHPHDPMDPSYSDSAYSAEQSEPSASYPRDAAFDTEHYAGLSELEMHSMVSFFSAASLAANVLHFRITI